MTIKTFVKATWAVSALSISTLSMAAGWVNDANVLNPGTTIQAINANANKNSYTSNPALKNNAWGMQGTWLSFKVPSTTSVLVSLTSDIGNAPGFTIYRTDGRFEGNGTGTTTGTNGAIHSFNQVGQAGEAGIVWATDNSVATSLAGNTTANGIVETLGYVNASGVEYTNGFGGVVKAGAVDTSIDDRFEQGVFGNVAKVGNLNYANLTLVNLAEGYYTLFLGGTKTDGTSAPIDVKVTALPLSSADCLFNWAENNYPKFTPKRPVSLTSSPYYYRYYPDSQIYIGISSADNHVYYAEGSGKAQDVGAAVDWFAQAGCI